MRCPIPILRAATANRRPIVSSGLRCVLVAALVLRLSAAGADVEFGDDAGHWALDGQCDDPRFEGAGAAATLLDDDLLHDATDCRTLFGEGLVSVRNAPGARTGSRIERGRLEDGDRRSAAGGLADDFRFVGRRGGLALLDLRSAAFVPELSVRTPSGKVLAGTGGERRSSFALELGEDGLYEATVTSRTPADRGNYTIAIALKGDLPPIRPLDRVGALADGDAVLQSGELVDTYEIEGWPGQRVSIIVESEAFDAYVILKGPSGRQIENDDAEADDGTSDSRIDGELEEIGIYEVLVTSYAPGESGPYRIAIAPASSTPVKRAPAPERPTLDIRAPRHSSVERGSITPFDIAFTR
jgi:hypothetical protein